MNNINSIFINPESTNSLKKNFLLSNIPKVIYMTYKCVPPKVVFERWKQLNPGFIIEFSLDNDCINFLKENFDETLANLFESINEGMYKADLWRLCKLYLNGGIYADIDLVPLVSLDDLIKEKNTFYSCLSIDNASIFQAFIVTPPKNPLILKSIFSFIYNKPYNVLNGPTYDIYNCVIESINFESLKRHTFLELVSKLNKINFTENCLKIFNGDIKFFIEPDVKYDIKCIKIKINIGPSLINIKKINLYNFEFDNYYIENISTEIPEKFNFKVNNNTLLVTRIDEHEGWDFEFSINICINYYQNVYLFKEEGDYPMNFVSNNNNRILESRDIIYYLSKINGINWSE
jgi:mannosyltransferase OCH1-like enzyme